MGGTAVRFGFLGLCLWLVTLQSALAQGQWSACRPAQSLLPVTAMVLLAAVGGAEGWVNSYDDPVLFECPVGNFMSSVSSRHDNDAEDRVWRFGCRALPKGISVSSCDWTSDVNDFDRNLNFECPNSGLVAGTASRHSNGAEDRRFRFKCCTLRGHHSGHGVRSSCTKTGDVNAWDQTFHFRCPNGGFVAGQSGQHSNPHEDRKFQFKCCTLSTKTRG